MIRTLIPAALVVGLFRDWHTAILIPAAAAFFKEELNSFLDDWRIYHSRPFDKDRNPNTPDYCQLFYEATGQWKMVAIERYTFGILPSARKVWIRHPIPDGRWAQEKISLSKWAQLRKRACPTRESWAIDLPCDRPKKMAFRVLRRK